MSTVYKALDLRFTNVERVCAVKEMFDPSADEATRRQRLANFEREAGLLAILSHPLIPKIFDFFAEHGRIYLVQEFIPGRDLESELEKMTDHFLESEVVEWAVQICDVLSYLHAQVPAPIIFRDMKPSNIMIREDRSLMLIDFGIARAFQPLQRGTMIGTEGYAPPEQYRGVADPRTDIYALGATLHHLATRSDPRFETPFTFDQRSPRALNSSLSPQFEAAVLRAVAYAPKDRFGSAAEFKAALLACRATGTNGTGPVAASQPPRASTSPTRPSTAPSRPVARAKPIPTRILSTPPELPVPSAASMVARPIPAPPAERLVWTLATGDEVRGTGAIAGELLLIGSYDKQLYAVDVASGAPRWQFATGRGICSTPTVWEDSVIVGSEDGAVYAVGLDSGRPKWRYRTNMPVRSSPRVPPVGSPSIAGGVFIGSDDNYLYKLDAANGGLLWRSRTYGPVRSSVAFARNLAVVGSDDGFIYALAQDSGHQAWRFAAGKPVVASPVVEREVVVCGSLDGTLYGLGAAGGEFRWRFETAGPVIASAATRDGRAYVGSTDGHFYALDVTTGECLWQVTHGGRITSTAALTQDAVYYGGLDGTVCCLDRESGALNWSYLLGRPVPASPVLHGGLLLIGGTNGRVYALATGEDQDAARMP